MSLREDTVAAQVAAVQTGELEVLQTALGSAFDAGEGSGNGPGFTQADIDAAVLAAVDPLNAQIANDIQILADAHSEADAAMAVVQQQLVDMTAKEQVEEQAVLSLQGSISQLQASLDVIKGIVFPVV